MIAPGRPVRRPPLSAPRGAVVALVLLYLLWGSAVPVTAMAIGWTTPAGTPILGFLPLVALSAAPLLTVAFGIRQGRVWSLTVMRWMVALSAMSLALDFALGVALIVGMIGGTRHDMLNGELLLILTAVLSALCVLEFRIVGRVRWLDPHASPEEWEGPFNRR